jgi:glucokinase
MRVRRRRLPAWCARSVALHRQFDTPKATQLSSGHSILVGDVGGTHARFAIVDTAGAAPWRVRQRGDLEQNFPTFTAALTSYLEHAGITDIPAVAVIAVAGPVTDGSTRFTNRGWEISEQELRRFGFTEAVLINDFAALAFAVEVLAKEDLRTIGPPLKGLERGTITILGAGTGFGVSCLARYGDRVVPMATEGGHMGFAPSDDEELSVLRLMSKQFGRVSIERILSGPGLESLYRALEQLGGREAPALTAAQIVAKATSNDRGGRAALTMFCSIFGAVAGDFALAHGARGGVYIAGGIAQKIEGFLAPSPFRSRFESKGRLSSFVAAIPTRLIVNADAALLGAARAGLVLAPEAAAAPP